MNNYLIKIIIWLPFTIICLNCQNRHENISSNIIEIPNSEKLSSFLEDSCVITKTVLFTDTARFISDISKLVYHDDIYYIFDRFQKKLLVFNSDGNFMLQVGAVGKGPGEYLEIRDFQIFKNHLYILDYEKLKKYSLDGVFIENISLKKISEKIGTAPLQFCILKNENYIFWIGNQGEFTKGNILFIVDKNLKILNKRFTFTNKYPDSFRFNSHNGNFLFAGLMGDYNLYSNCENDICVNFSLVFDNKIVNNTELKNKQALYQKIEQNKIVHSLREVYTTETYISFIYQVGNIPYMGLYNKRTGDVKVGNCIKPMAFGGGMIRATTDKEFVLYYPLSVVGSSDFNSFTGLTANNSIYNPVLLHISIPSNHN